MAKNMKIVLAVAYCRKSTNEERTEKSIADQRARINKLKPQDHGAVYKIVQWYDKDKGVPGWKRGHKRPDYHKLVEELKETGAKAILVDDMDRFSRADEIEVMHHVQELRETHRVRYIHAVNQGCIDIVTDQFAGLKIAMSAMAGHEFSTRLSRRVANARLDAAEHGLRSGGCAPFGMVMADIDGKPCTPGTHLNTKDRGRRLIPGDPKEVKVVQWIFDQFVKYLKSMNWIAAQLNLQKVKRRREGTWFVATVKELLQRREYRGDFTYNHKKSGQFHIINKVEGRYEVVRISDYHDDKPKRWKATTDSLIVKTGTHEPIIQPEIFDAAQKRLAGFAMKGSRRPRVDGYPLSRILICDHCGKPLYGCHPKGRHRVYRCSTPAKSGSRTCGMYEVREELILPHVLRMLGEEITNLHELLSVPPDDLRHPGKERKKQREAREREREELAEKIAQGDANIMFVKDARTRQALDQKLTELRDQLERLDVELSQEEPRVGYSKKELADLAKWWEEFNARALSVPIPGDLHPATVFWQDRDTEEQAILIDARVVNEVLHDLGAEVRLRWKTVEITRPSGKKQTRHQLVRGRFRLGQRHGILRMVPAG